MTIAVDARFLGRNALEEHGEFRKELLIQLVRRLPQHQFSLITDQPISNLFSFSNAQIVALGPRAANPVLWMYWLDISLPPLLKKMKVDIFLGLDGQISIRTKIPQYFFADDGSWRTSTDGSKLHRFFYKRYLPKFIKKADAAFVLSDAIGSGLLGKYGLTDGKIAVLPPAINDIYTPIGWEERVAIKEQYTQGKEYFLCHSNKMTAAQLLDLLKAFSFFKKRQRSEMKMVITGDFIHQKQSEELLGTFKYRGDVIIANKETEIELARLIAAAYAVIQADEGFTTSFLKAMQSGVPVLLAEKSGMKEYAGDAALYFRNNIAEMAEMMMFIYKDETTRSQLIQKGKERSAEYNWQRTIDVIIEALPNQLSM